MYYIIYETTNTINGKKYRGAHQTEKLDDGYLGSGIIFLKAVKKYGKDNFKRTILSECDNINDMILKESEFVNEEWVNRDDTYNLQTGGLNYGILSEESKLKISNTLKQKYINGELTPTYGALGTEPWNKGKTDVYSEETLKQMSESRKGKEPWNKGKKEVQVPWNKGKRTGPRSEEAKQKCSETLKDLYKNKEHHRKGKEPWNKGKKGVQVPWNKGIPADQFECPHCGKLIGGINNFKRWHDDNCKHKD